MAEPTEPTESTPAGPVRVLGVFAGRVQIHLDEQGRFWRSGLLKDPVSDHVDVGPTGLTGDEQADLRVHGGPDKAVFCFPESNYALLRVELGIPDLTPPAFGENLLLSGVDEHSVCLGDRWRIGTVLAEVSQPRRPCWKPARYWQRKELVPRVEESGRVGWYLRILESGQVWVGAEPELVERPNPRWTVMAAHVAMRDRQLDPQRAAELRDCPTLADRWKDTLGRFLSGQEPTGNQPDPSDSSRRGENARTVQAHHRTGVTVAFSEIVEAMGKAVDIAGVVAIILGVIVATLMAAGALLRKAAGREVYHRYRERLGRSILLGLELLVAADIIRTVAVTPNFSSVGVLGLIVLIRTFLSFSLELEITGRWPWQKAAPTQNLPASDSPLSGTGESPRSAV